MREKMEENDGGDTHWKGDFSNRSRTDMKVVEPFWLNTCTMSRL